MGVSCGSGRSHRTGQDIPGGLLGRDPPRPPPLKPTSDSRRMLRFSLLPVLVPFPLVGFCSGMVTSGAGRGSECTVQTSVTTQVPPGEGLGQEGDPSNWVWVQQKQSSRGSPAGGGPLLRARPRGLPRETRVRWSGYGTRWGFPPHLLKGHGLERGVPRRPAHPPRHPAHCSSPQTKEALRRGSSTYSPCLSLWRLPSSGSLVWVTVQTPTSPLSSPLPVKDGSRQMKVLPP